MLCIGLLNKRQVCWNKVYKTCLSGSIIVFLISLHKSKKNRSLGRPFYLTSWNCDIIFRIRNQIRTAKVKRESQQAVYIKDRGQFIKIASIVRLQI